MSLIDLDSSLSAIMKVPSFLRRSRESVSRSESEPRQPIGEASSTNDAQATSPQHLAVETSPPSSPTRSMEALEIDQMGSHASAASWVQRVSWLQHKHPPSDSYAESPRTPYYEMEADGIMKEDLRRPNSFDRLSSWFRSPRRQDSDVVAFREWTPADSSYGAAIPVAGWIPKHIRRAIEATMIALTLMGLVYLVVTTSIKVTEHARGVKNSTATDKSSATVDLNDDWYVAYNDDKVSGDDLVDDLYDDLVQGGDDNYYAANTDDDGNGGRWRD